LNIVLHILIRNIAFDHLQGTKTPIGDGLHPDLTSIHLQPTGKAVAAEVGVVVIDVISPSALSYDPSDLASNSLSRSFMTDKSSSCQTGDGIVFFCTDFCQFGTVLA